VVNITDKIYNDEDAAREHLEANLWPNGAVCPFCNGQRVTKLQGKSTRPGVWKCKDCRKPFSVTVGTVFERSHIPLHKWVLASHLMGASKKGISAHQLWRMLGFGSYKTAWFMAHRLREAMRPAPGEPMGGAGGAVEVDETFIGRDNKNPPEPGHFGRAGNMNKVLSLIDRDSGEARSYVIKDLRITTIAPILDANIAREARLMTDEAARYTQIGWNFASHGVVNHSKEEYVSAYDRSVHTNTVEGFYSVFKRGMRGIYQHCGSHHLHRYVAEFDFRYSNRMALGVDDTARAEKLLKGAVGKRLTYRRSYGARDRGLHSAQAF